MTTPGPASDAVPPPGCPAHAGARTVEPLYGPEFAADPMASYTRLRSYGSVAPVEIAPGVRASLVTGYETALEVLRSPERFSKDPRRWRALADGTVPADSPVVPMMMYRPNALWTDGDEHSRLRGAITDSLGRVDPNALRGYVEHSADTLIDRIGPNGRADLLSEYGAVLPLLVFNQLFGCPPRTGDKLVEGMSGIFDANADSEKANAVLTEGVAELVALKRSQPGPDVTSWLMAHPAQLTDEEMMHQLVVLMGAGTEPQQNLICNGLRLLLSDDRFGGDLAGGSMPVEDAIDEVLWTDPPIANYAIHYPIHDLELDGTLVCEGEPILISLAAANTDTGLAGDRRTGNRAHLAWSAGPHTCPAKSPARLIAAVALEKLLDRLPDIELAIPAAELRWRQGPFHRALTALPVRFPRISPADRPSEGSEGNTHPVLSPSVPPAPTSAAREPGSADMARQRWWSPLARWWHGR
ncbi:MULTISPECIES: cytochrome P450 [unclassified Streptomyces]|uniref:cytochrome P450 n=1 Tax=unclassified Streptomyces TaxID=2593676 RepID=UPI002DD9E716|nr:cytochrome P450 [Streptomyces sp. NBC_01750]WSA98755.1 cytochrome P450 [Streptomyces sp. NBC_01794]WSD36675.1 cytochrome P450 [Streptomyces sp. NBC_01750]